MAITRAEDIILRINEKIEPARLARHLAYFPEKIQETPTAVKCFCPIHKERAMRSLTLDTSGHQFRCSMKQCAAFAGGTFVDLWALYKEMAPLDAALDLAEKLKLDIDVQALRLLGKEMVEQARQALSAGQLDVARSCVDQAMAFDAKDIEAGRISAQIHLRAGDRDRANDEFARVIDLCLEAGDRETARSLLNPLLASNPQHVPFAVRRVALAKADGNGAAAAEGTLILAALHSRAGDEGEELEALDETISNPDASIEVLERAAEIHRKASRVRGADRTLARLVPLLEKAGAWEKLYPVLLERQKYVPDDLEVREKLAVALARLGRTEEAAALLVKLAEGYRGRGELQKAQEILQELVRAQPDNRDAMEQLAALANDLGNRREAIDAYRGLAELSRKEGRLDEAVRHLESARAIDPNDYALRRDLAETRIAGGDLEGGVRQLFELADNLLTEADSTEGFLVLARIDQLAPDDVERQIEIGRCLEAAGYDEQALAGYLKFISRLQGQDLNEEALRVSEEARRLAPRDEAVLEARITSTLSLERLADAIRICRDAAAASIQFGDYRAAENLLERAIRIDPTDGAPQRELATLLEQVARIDEAARRWTALAEMERGKGALAEAVDAARSALRLADGDVDAKCILADCLERQGQTEEALSLLRRAAARLLDSDPRSDRALELLEHASGDLAPSDLGLLAQLADLKFEVRGADDAKPHFDEWMRRAKAQDPAGAYLQAANRAVERYPAELVWRLALADALAAVGSERHAVPHLEVVLAAHRADPLSPEYRQTLERLVRVAPERLDIRFEWADALGQAGEKDRAAQVFGEIAQLHLDAGDDEEALRVLLRSLDYEPDGRELLLRVGELQERLGLVADAIASYERLVELSRRIDTWRSNVGVLEKLLELAPDRVELRLELARACEAHGEIEKAVAQYHRVAETRVKESPDDPETLFIAQKLVQLAPPEMTSAREMLVECLLQQGETERAKTELDALGEIAIKAGDLDRAEGLFKRIQTIDPRDIGAGERLGRLYEARGEIDEAASAYREVLSLYEAKGDAERVVSALIKLKGLAPKDLDLRARLARALSALPDREDEAVKEWYDLVSLAIGENRLEVAKASLGEARALFEPRWDYRFKIIQLFGRVQDAETTVRNWKAFCRQALDASQDMIAREGAAVALQLAEGDSELLEARIEANKRLDEWDDVLADLDELARRASEEARPDLAEAFVLRAIEISPKSTALWASLAGHQIAQSDAGRASHSLRKLAELLRDEGDLEGAIEQARRIVGLQPEGIDARDFLAELLIAGERVVPAMDVWREIAEIHARAGDADKAIERYDALLGNLPRDVAALRRVADVVFESLGPDAAEPRILRLLDTMMDDDPADVVEAEFKRVVALDPARLPYGEKFAEYLYSMGDTKAACEELLRIARVHETEREDFAEAHRVIRQIRSWAPGDLAMLEEEANILEKMGEPQKAADVLEELSRQWSLAGDDPRAAEVVARRADILADKVDAQIRAAEFFERLAEDERATEFYLRAIGLLDEQGDLESCVPHLQRAMQLNPDRQDLGVTLATIYEHVERVELAVAEWLRLGAVNESLGDPDQAIQFYDRVKQISPEDLEARRRLSRVRAENGDEAGALVELRELAPLAGAAGLLDETISVLSRILELDPADEESMLALAARYREASREGDLFDALMRLERFYLGADRLDDAVSTMAELRRLRPDDLELAEQNFELLVKTGRESEAAGVGTFLVETFLQSGDDARAEAMIARVDGISPADVDRRIALARLADDHGCDEIARRAFARGVEELVGLDAEPAALRLVEAGLATYPEDVDLRRLKVEVHRRLGDSEAAIAEQIALASLFESRGDLNAAIGALDEILADHADSVPTHEAIIRLALRLDDMERTEEHLVRLAEIHYAAGELPQAIMAIERLLEISPERHELRTRLAELHHEAGSADEARRVWREAARGFVVQGDLAQAIAVHERVLEIHPREMEALERLVECLEASGDLDARMRRAVELADLRIETDEHHSAAALLETLVAERPERLDLWERLAVAHQGADEPAEASRCLKKIAELHKNERRLDKARAALEKALALRDGDVEAIQKLGEVCLQLDQKAEGLAHLDRAARILSEAGMNDEAREIVERILRIDASNLGTRRTLGFICESMGDHAEAVKNYALAARGWAERRDNDKALEAYERVLALDPARPEDREAYGLALERAGRAADAVAQWLEIVRGLAGDADPRTVIRLCRAILKDAPDNVDAHLSLYKVYERTRKPRLALEEAQWLADYYMSLGEMDYAEEYIRRGLEQSPTEIELRKRFVDILIETGRAEEASQNLAELAGSARSTGDLRTSRWALQKACEVEPSSMQRRQELAQLLEVAGEMAEARKVRLDIVRMLLEKGEMEEARATGERVMQSAPEDEPLRRTVAAVFEEAGLPEVAAFHYNHIAQSALRREDYPTAIEIADHILKIKPRHVHARDCLVKAFRASGDATQAYAHARELYALHLESGDLDQAQVSLQTLVQLRPSDPEPRRFMIELFRRMGETDKMVEAMRKLAEIHANAADNDGAVAALRELLQVRPDDTQARVRYIDIYSQGGEESELFDDYLHLAFLYRRKGSVLEASQVYDKLLRMDPSRTDCREQFVQFLFDQGQVSRGVEEARALVDLYLKADLKAEAGRALERALAKEPQDTRMRHQLATLQLMTNRRGMALETLRGLLKQYEQMGDDAAMVEVMEKILSIDSLNIELRERLAEKYRDLGRNDKMREQRVALAQQYLDRQMFDLAEREYGRILEADPADVEIWHKKIETHLQIGGEKEVVPDMMALGAVLVELGRLRDAVNLFAKIRDIEPDNIDVLSRYIETYVEVGMEEDLVDDYLRLATLLSQAGNVEGALRIYQHLQELAPENTRVRLGLQEPGAEPAPAPRAIPAGGPADSRVVDRRIPVAFDMQSPGFASPPTPTPGNIAALAAASAPAPQGPGTHHGSDPQMEQMIRNYENILKLNPENPHVRDKLARQLARTGRMKEADDQWAQAAVDFFNKGEFDKCIEILEELVGRHPEDARLRERLSRALLQRESMNALGSIADFPGGGTRG